MWKKTAATQGPDEQVMAFLAGEDVLLDAELIGFDIKASQAHAEGLVTIGVLTSEEGRSLVTALDDIRTELSAGTLVLDQRFEDGHSALESWLTDRLGPLGGKIHTGRSRNDQVAVALRMYLKDRLQRLATICLDIAGICLDGARAQPDLPMPGYTHLQRAMPSSTGLWLAGHAECFIDNAELSQQIHQWLDASPLGTASGFGVNLPLARGQVSETLGFARLVTNPQCAQNSRGKVELQALSALAAATGDLRRLAWDLSLFTSAEFNFVQLPDRYCTGSSIMPNKRNPDVVELMRAVHGVVVGARSELEAVLSLPSGYQRDLQATKPPVMRAFRSALQALDLAPGLLAGMEWNSQVMAAAMAPELFATDLSVELVLQGVPFREAYREVGDRIASLGAGDAAKSLRERVSPGGCGDLMLDGLQARYQALR
jgi:argininosuccinate lyase